MLLFIYLRKIKQSLKKIRVDILIYYFSLYLRYFLSYCHFGYIIIYLETMHLRACGYILNNIIYWICLILLFRFYFLRNFHIPHIRWHSFLWQAIPYFLKDILKYNFPLIPLRQENFKGFNVQFISYRTRI